MVAPRQASSHGAISAPVATILRPAVSREALARVLGEVQVAQELPTEGDSLISPSERPWKHYALKGRALIAESLFRYWKGCGTTFPNTRRGEKVAPLVERPRFTAEFPVTTRWVPLTLWKKRRNNSMAVKVILDQVGIGDHGPRSGVERVGSGDTRSTHPAAAGQVIVVAKDSLASPSSAGNREGRWRQLVPQTAQRLPDRLHSSRVTSSFSTCSSVYVCPSKSP